MTLPPHPHSRSNGTPHLNLRVPHPSRLLRRVGSDDRMAQSLFSSFFCSWVSLLWNCQLKTANCKLFFLGAPHAAFACGFLGFHVGAAPFGFKGPGLDSTSTEVAATSAFTTPSFRAKRGIPLPISISQFLFSVLCHPERAFCAKDLNRSNATPHGFNSRLSLVTSLPWRTPCL